MSCENCNGHSDPVAQAAEAGRIMGDMVQAYDRQNRRLWVAVLALTAALLVSAGCMIWAVTNAQKIANEAMLNALNSVAEIGVTQETTTTQTVDGDSATINNVDGEQYNDSTTNQKEGS